MQKYAHTNKHNKVKMILTLLLEKPNQDHTGKIR